MQSMLRPILLSFSIVSSISLVACQKPPKSVSAESTANASTASQTVSASEVMPSHIRSFAATANDEYDIQQLDQFNHQFHDMTQDMRSELEQLKQQQQLTAEFVAQRKHDQIHSALNMLKDLDLKTEQGRYIQGMMADYWNQRLQETPSQKADKSLMLQATQQLEYWKAHHGTSTPSP